MLLLLLLLHGHWTRTLESKGERSLSRGLAESAEVLLGTLDPHHPPGPSLMGAPQTW